MLTSDGNALGPRQGFIECHELDYSLVPRQPVAFPSRRSHAYRDPNIRDASRTYLPSEHASQIRNVSCRCTFHLTTAETSEQNDDDPKPRTQEPGARTAELAPSLIA